MMEVMRAIATKNNELGLPKDGNGYEISRSLVLPPLYIDESDGVWLPNDKNPPRGDSNTYKRTLEALDKELAKVRDDEEVGYIQSQFIVTGNQKKGIRHVTADIFIALYKKKKEEDNKNGQH